MKAVLCPVCNGTGKYKERDYHVQDCHGCEGFGWVEVEEYPYDYIPYYPPTIYYCPNSYLYTSTDADWQSY